MAFIVKNSGLERTVDWKEQWIGKNSGLERTVDWKEQLKTPLHILKTQPNLEMIWRKINSQFCSPRNPVCPPPDYPYRSADGSCNNLDHILWGMSNRPQKRNLPADYQDGMDLSLVLFFRNIVPVRHFKPSPHLDNLYYLTYACVLFSNRLIVYRCVRI
ncbi:hypothetical protein CHS0354_037757 [Potamilus streckersoni]|uniref:Uncharacterized protein n=1 Tax=Potamilus streckersoni TaxID=2493646 RepID=A0AAE0T491_9BIVA|nr:hypothetical protein CHS0354_037757 [Potamilus streckersoni]